MPLVFRHCQPPNYVFKPTAAQLVRISQSLSPRDGGLAQALATFSPMTNSSQLAYENQQVLTLVHAMLGAISPNMRAVSMRFVGSRIHLHFVLERENAADQEEIRDIAAEFEALQERGVEIEIHVSVSTEVWPNGTNSLIGRPVYVRRAM